MSLTFNRFLPANGDGRPVPGRGILVRRGRSAILGGRGLWTDPTPRREAVLPLGLFAPTLAQPSTREKIAAS